MEIEFDDTKEVANIAKHGVSLALGAVILECPIGELEDRRRVYGEIRINSFGLVEGRLVACTYTRHGKTYRIISVRKASRQEQRAWLS